MKSVNAEIGNRIRLYRQRSKLSQERLALNAGITVSFLGDIERGVKKPSIESLEKLLGALDVTFIEFFDYELEIKPYRDHSALEKLNLLLRNRENDEVEMVFDVVKRMLEYNDMCNSVDLKDS